MSKQRIASPETPRRIALSCVVATATTAVALAAPTAALAEEPAAAPPTSEPSTTTATAEAPSATAPYTATQTVAKDEKTFPTKDDAQTYLDNAKATWAETDKKDATSTFEVKTTGPEKVDSTTTTTVKEENEEFGTKDEADKWVKDNTSGYQNTGDTTYDVKSGVEEVESETTEEKIDSVASGNKDGFQSEQEAKDWVAWETAQYQNDTTYTVDSTVTSKENSDKRGEKNGDATTQTYGPYDSESKAEAAKSAEAAKDPASTLHEVTFDVFSKEAGTQTKTEHVDGRTFDSASARDASLEQEVSNAKADGWTVMNVNKTSNGSVAWGGKYDCQSEEYQLKANSFAIIKQADWHAIWTPGSVDKETIAAIAQAAANDKSLKGDPIFFSGFDTYFSTGDKTSGEYWVTSNPDGSYTVHVSSADKISHLDYGTLPTYSYTFDKTRQTPILKWYFTKTVQNYKPAVEWSAKYTVSSVTKVPTYKYNAWYKVTKTERVTKETWKAGYEVVKTTTFTPPVTPPTTPKTPETPKATVQTTTVQKQAAATTAAKAAVPRTSDSTNLAGAGILAGLAVAFGAAGIALRRHARKFD